MHTISEMGTSVPAFLGKLWRLVEDPETDDLICWSPNGRSFFIRNQAQFARELLPHYYKHNNMASFVRQLNMYGFHKKVSVELGGLKCDRDEMEFAHQYFCKDHPYLLDHIKRKIASNKTQDPSQAPIKPELMNRMLTEVRSIRGRQEHFDSRLGAMKRENEALWRELALLRQKHHKQQQIVNKLIHFLVSLVQPNRSSGLSMKRRYPLMIDDSSRQRIRQSKISKLHQSPIGPAIHELDSSDQDLDSDYIVAEMLDNDQTPTIESPDHHNIAEDNMEEYYTDEPIQLPHEVKICQNINVSKKRFKGKKKGRKNKVPIKILIPSSENGEETREETLMLEVQLNKVKAVPAVTTSASLTTATISKPTSLKPVPMATVRSSKLAAMAANMKKNQEVELDLDLNSYEETENEEPKDDSLIKLENILIVPGVTNEDYNSELGENNDNTIPSSVSSLSGNSTNNGSPPTEENSPDASNLDNGTFRNLDLMNDSVISQAKSPSASKQIEAKNMSLSRISPGSTSESNYRLGSMEEVDTHLDTMQSELDNLREILRGEGYSIDANTLLGLFGAEDPMSFGIPINPDLDPHSNQEKESDDHHMNVEQCGSSNKGELMAYNTTPSLLDFDDDIFLGASSSPVPVVTDVSNTGFSNDTLELAKNKANIFDSLIAANNTNSPQS